jgi:hypothetical protein
MRLLELCDFLCQGPIFIDKFTLNPLMELLRSLAILLESFNLIEELLVDYGLQLQLCGRLNPVDFVWFQLFFGDRGRAAMLRTHKTLVLSMRCLRQLAAR